MYNNFHSLIFFFQSELNIFQNKNNALDEEFCDPTSASDKPKRVLVDRISQNSTTQTALLL